MSPEQALAQFLAVARLAKHRILSVGEVMSLLIVIHDQYEARQNDQAEREAA